MRFLPRLVIFCGLAYLCAVLFLEGRRLLAQEAADPSQLFLVFGGALAVAILAGVLVALTLLPMLGEGFANLIYGEASLPTLDPLLLARERVADGEYLEARSLYRQALAGNPDDTAALGELAELEWRHLADVPAAVALLERALEKPWPEDEKAFLGCHLARAYAQQPETTEMARALLREIVLSQSGTPAARSAQHLLHDLESA